jgi:hypothetical protein
MKPEGIFKNGDLWFGDRIREDDTDYFIAREPDTENIYETPEVPERFPLFAMIIFPDGTPESEAQQYFLAKRIGDQRFGSECQHARAKRSYCPDCLRKVI